MKRALLIPILLLAFVVLSSKQCADDVNPQAELEAQMEEIENVKKGFEADYLKSESLYAYGERAKQKLLDFADYLNIAKDTDLDTNFRKHSRNMIPGLFNQQELPSLINRPIKHINIHTIHVLEPLSRSSAMAYTGMLGFSLELTEKAGIDTIINDARQWSVEMIVLKTPTILGKDTILAWKVFLGQMKKL